MINSTLNSSEPTSLGAAQITSYDGEIRWDAIKPDGQPRRAVDASRAREQLGFTAHSDLKDGLRQTITWYESHGHILDLVPNSELGGRSE